MIKYEIDCLELFKFQDANNMAIIDDYQVFSSFKKAKLKIKSDIDLEIDCLESDLKDLKEYRETLKNLKAGDLEMSPCFYD